MKRLAVIPSDPIEDYFKKGFSAQWLTDYYNPGKFFDEVFLLSELEKDQADLLGMKVIHTPRKQFGRRIKELNIDLVRAYGGNWACTVACEHKVSGIPVVVSVHDTSPTRLYDSIKKADIVFCVSKAVRDLVSTKFKQDEKVWLLPNRVDFENMHPYEGLEIKHLEESFPFRYKILHVGRRSSEKNLDTLLRALALLDKEYCVIAIGQGDKKVYQELAQQLGILSQTFFIDSVEHEKLGTYFSLADCMCTPSLREGFGIVFIEALACETIVVTSDIAPLNEYIKNETNGLLVKEFENPHALAEALKRACTDENLRARLKSNARESVRMFEKKTIEQLESQYYERILKMKDQGEFNRSFWNILGKRHVHA